MSDIHYYHLQLDGVYQNMILNLDLKLAKESLEVHTYTCVCALVFRCDRTLIYTFSMIKLCMGELTVYSVASINGHSK